MSVGNIRGHKLSFPYRQSCKFAELSELSSRSAQLTDFRKLIYLPSSAQLNDFNTISLRKNSKKQLNSAQLSSIRVCSAQLRSTTLKKVCSAQLTSMATENGHLSSAQRISHSAQLSSAQRK